MIPHDGGHVLLHVPSEDLLASYGFNGIVGASLLVARSHSMYLQHSLVIELVTYLRLGNAPPS